MVVIVRKQDAHRFAQAPITITINRRFLLEPLKLNAVQRTARPGKKNVALERPPAHNFDFVERESSQFDPHAQWEIGTS
jgi:hypothetical protein